MPCARNEVGDDKFHGSVSVHLHVYFAGQGQAVLAESHDPVGYLYAHHFPGIDTFHVIHPFAGVVCHLHHVQKVVFGGGNSGRHFYAPCSSFVGIIGTVGQCVVRIVGAEHPEFFSFAAHFFYLGITGFRQQHLVLQHARIPVLGTADDETVAFYYGLFDAVQQPELLELRVGRYHFVKYDERTGHFGGM